MSTYILSEDELTLIFEAVFAMGLKYADPSREHLDTAISDIFNELRRTCLATKDYAPLSHCTTLAEVLRGYLPTRPEAWSVAKHFEDRICATEARIGVKKNREAFMIKVGKVKESIGKIEAAFESIDDSMLERVDLSDSDAMAKALENKAQDDRTVEVSYDFAMRPSGLESSG